jgi:hypothetical protein
MAGRGCTVTVQISRLVNNEMQTDEISLPVALHSPLLVLKEMLQDISGIEMGNQVLILCDLTDADRNGDIHLDADRDEATLFQCGLRQGSVLTLHSVGITRHDIVHASRKPVPQYADPRPKHYLSSQITPAAANHSYNGIIFSICSKSPYELDVFSFCVGGMLGRLVSLYIRFLRKWLMENFLLSAFWLNKAIGETPKRIMTRKCSHGR